MVTLHVGGSVTLRSSGDLSHVSVALASEKYNNKLWYVMLEELLSCVVIKDSICYYSSLKCRYSIRFENVP